MAALCEGDIGAGGGSSFDVQRVIAVMLATVGMATQWATLHGVTFFWTIFEGSQVSRVGSFWVVNTLATLAMFVVCLVLSRRVSTLLRWKHSIETMGALIAVGQVTLLVSTIVHLPLPLLLASDVLLACGTTPLIVAWGETYKFMDPKDEQLFITLVAIVMSVVLYFIEVELPDAVALIVYVCLPMASLACLRRVNRLMEGLMDSWVPRTASKPRRSAALFYICIAIFSIPYNYLIDSEGIRATMSLHTVWASVLSVVIVVMIAITLAEVAAERHGFLLSPTAVLVLLSAAMLFHALPTGSDTQLVPMLLFSGYYLFLSMVYLALGPIVAMAGHNPVRVFSAAMIANVGGLVLGTVLEHLVSAVDSSIASVMVMTLTYAILFFGFVLLSNRSYSIFRVNYFDRDVYSFEYVVPVIPISLASSKVRTKSVELTIAPGSEGSYVAALTRSCDAIAASDHLSAREHEVLCELARGKTIASIASCLVLSENTVKAHTKSIYRKLGVHTREELLAVIERHDTDA